MRMCLILVIGFWLPEGVDSAYDSFMDYYSNKREIKLLKNLFDQYSLKTKLASRNPICCFKPLLICHPRLFLVPCITKKLSYDSLMVIKNPIGQFYLFLAPKHLANVCFREIVPIM